MDGINEYPNFCRHLPGWWWHQTSMISFSSFWTILYKVLLGKHCSIQMPRYGECKLHGDAAEDAERIDEQSGHTAPGFFMCCWWIYASLLLNYYLFMAVCRCLTTQWPRAWWATPTWSGRCWSPIRRCRRFLQMEILLKIEKMIGQGRFSICKHILDIYDP